MFARLTVIALLASFAFASTASAQGSVHKAEVVNDLIQKRRDYVCPNQLDSVKCRADYDRVMRENILVAQGTVELSQEIVQHFQDLFVNYK
jgi:hypothetical protein